MKIALGWQPPAKVWDHQLRVARRLIFWMAVRTSLLSYTVGFGLWYAVVVWCPLPLPKVWFTVVPWIIIVMGGMWWLAYPMTFKRRVTRQITRWGIGDLRWPQIKAFDVQPMADLPEYDELILYLGRGRTKRLTLPEDARRQRAVVNWIARKTAWIEDCADAQTLRRKPTPLPWWYMTTCLLAACGWAIFSAWVIDQMFTHRKISGDVAQLLLFVAAAFQPAGWLAVGLCWHPGFHRTGDQRIAVWGISSLLVVMVGLSALIVFRW